MTPTMPKITRYPVHPNNYTKGRTTMPVGVVLHVTEGSRAGVRSHFADGSAKVSAYYSVNRDGTVDQFVDERDTAYTQGRILRPTAPLVIERGQQSPNAYLIGVEHEGTGREPATPAQLAASLALVHDICRRHKIPLERRYILEHREIFAGKTCPGALFRADDYVAELRRFAGLDRPVTPAPVVDRVPLAVYSRQLADWLIVGHVTSDAVWTFLRSSDVRRGVTKLYLAGAPLSVFTDRLYAPAAP